MLHFVRALIGLALMALAPAVLAQHPYLVGSVGQSHYNFECGPNGCDRTPSSWRAGAGLRFNRIVAAEAFYADYGKARSSDPGLEGHFKGTAAGLQVLAGWQFAAIDVAGKIGVASVTADFTAAPTSFYPSTRRRHNELIGGVMFGYRFTEHLAFRIDVDIVTVALQTNGIYYSNGADVVTVVGGLAFQF